MDEAGPRDSPIALHSTLCIDGFNQVCSLLQDPDRESQYGITYSKICDELGRFRIWAGNIGALQHVNVRSSLDYRLKDAPMLRDQISRLLVDLNAALVDGKACHKHKFFGHLADRTEVCSIASGRKPNRVSSASDYAQLQRSLSESEGLRGEMFNMPTVSEIQERFQSASDNISHLFRLSVIIRNATPRDRYAKAAAAAIEPFDDQYDISHVGHKFPRLEMKENEWLKIRLGRAITQRRQYLRYCREHHEKLSKASALTDASESEPKLKIHTQDVDLEQKSNLKMRSQIANTIAPSSHVQTTASTLMPSNIETSEIIEEDRKSQFSYATSMDESSNPDIRQIVPLAKVTEGGLEFECPYCWSIRHYIKESLWRLVTATTLV